MSAVAQPNITPLEQVMPGVGSTLSQVVMKALAVDPAQRFQTAEELRGRLQASLMEVDPSTGPESISRYMHELFSTEYHTERRMLASFREVGRTPEPEPVVIGMPEGVAPRSGALLPAKTIRLDGPVEALSFKPTPRTHEGGPGGGDGETRPAVVMDEPTRPAVAKEAIEASRQRPPPPPDEAAVVPEPPDFPMPGMVAPTRELQLPPAPILPAPPPIAAWLAEEEAGALSGEDKTPMWAEPLLSSEPAKAAVASRELRSPLPPPVPAPWDEVPAEPVRPSAPVRAAPPPMLAPVLEDGLPVLSTEDLSPMSVDVRMEDTQPRVQRPAPRAARPEPVPRAAPAKLQPEDTNPRVVLDASLMREPEPEEVSQSGRVKTQTGSRPAVPRRRVTSTGISVAVPSGAPRATGSAPKLSAVPARESRRDMSPEERTDRDEPSGVQAPPSASGASRSGNAGWMVALTLLALVGGSVGAGLYFMLHPEQLPPPLRARMLVLLGRSPEHPEGEGVPPARALGPSKSDLPADAHPQPIVPPPSAPTAATAAAPDKPATAEVPATPPPGPPVEVAQNDDPLLVPLQNRPRGPRVKHSTRTPAQEKEWRIIEKQWVKTSKAYFVLTGTYGCEGMILLCERYKEQKDLFEEEMMTPSLFGDMRKLQNDIEAESKKKALH